MNLNDFVVLLNELENYNQQLEKGSLNKQDIEIIQKNINLFNFYIAKFIELKYEFSKIICFNSLLEEGFSWESLKEFFDNDDFALLYQKYENDKLDNNLERSFIFKYYKYLKNSLQIKKYYQDEENDTTNKIKKLEL